MTSNVLDYLSNRTVLYAEDEKDIQKSVSEILELFFHEVICVDNGEDALAEYYDSNPDILLLDIYMPKMDGIDVVKKIREENKTIPVILLSAHTEQEYLWRAIEQNITRYLVKPFNKDSLLEALEAIIVDATSEKLSEDFEFGIYEYTSKIFKDSEGKENQLSKSESALFELLIEKKDSVVSYDEIYEYFWKFDKGETKDAIKGLVKEIRKKTHPDCIKNVYGIGYKIGL